MRRRTTSLARGFALAATFCVLGGAGGCGRETFDLLGMAGTAGAFSGTAGAFSGGSAGAAAGGTFGGAPEAGVSSGAAAGDGGRSNSGAGGRRNFPEGGAGGSAPCFNASGPPCVAGSGGGCPVSIPFCTECVTSKDCDADTPLCDQDKGRCYQCMNNADCTAGQACFLGRCAKRCKEMSDCDSEADHRMCRSGTGTGVCVGCIYQTDCALYSNGTPNGKRNCFVSECVECSEDHDCQNGNYCVAGHCQKQR